MALKTRRIVGIFLVLAAIIVAAFLYIFRSAPEDLTRAHTDYHLQAKELLDAFIINEQEAMEKYGGKILEVAGVLQSTENDEWGQTLLIFLDPFFGVTATIDSLMVVKQEDLLKALAPGDSLVIKGRCDGMLSDVRLVKCFVIE